MSNARAHILNQIDKLTLAFGTIGDQVREMAMRLAIANDTPDPIQDIITIQDINTTNDTDYGNMLDNIMGQV